MTVSTKTTQLSIDRFLSDGRPACAVYSKEDGHKSCRFLQTRRYGTVYVCGLNAVELPDGGEVKHLAPEWCPLEVIK